MDKQICAGNPTFNLAVEPGAPSEWPGGISGYICKTPPFGISNAPRFAECCSGPVHNITSPLPCPDDPAHPVSCATFCQVDPVFNEASETNPHYFSDYFLCLTNGLELSSDWEVLCGWNDIYAHPCTYEL